ncbi:MAG: hypothetical protein SVW02_00260 [Candidatus Nanohaloarchaea archaeon]|nr:hypothetical protein [Candidatus Nanohaloarchaea archaeon]
MGTRSDTYTPDEEAWTELERADSTVLGYLLRLLSEAPEQHDDPEAEALHDDMLDHVNRYFEELRAYNDEAAEWELALAREAAVQYQAIERWERNPAKKGHGEETYSPR